MPAEHRDAAIRHMIVTSSGDLMARSHMLLVLAMLGIVTAAANAAGPFGLATSPPMGFRSWTAYHSDVSQAKLIAAMDAMSAKQPTTALDGSLVAASVSPSLALDHHCCLSHACRCSSEPEDIAEQDAMTNKDASNSSLAWRRETRTEARTSDEGEP